MRPGPYRRDLSKTVPPVSYRKDAGMLDDWIGWQLKVAD